MKPQVVVLGMMSKIPVAGVVWQTVHYLLGLERLGFAAYYVEAHARTPSMFMAAPGDDGSGRAAAFIDGTMRRFGLAGRWAFHALHDDGRCYGMTERELRGLYRSAALLVNLHGGTQPLPEHAATGRLVYVETDPVQLQVELVEEQPETIAFLEPHVALFTFAENYGAPDCGLPVSGRFSFHATRQPVVLDLWAGYGGGRGSRYTTVGNWRQDWREVRLRGDTYTWSKHTEFLKVLELPSRVGPRFELALGGIDAEDRARLEAAGWGVRDALRLSSDINAYRSFVACSRGELTVAKDQNVRLRSGWFSDRSATYLAAGRPVVTQDTGFGVSLPTGLGLLPFQDLDGAADAIEQVEADYDRHARAAAEIARERFDASRVLADLVGTVGLAPSSSTALCSPLPRELDLRVQSRAPTTLADATARSSLALPLAQPLLRPHVSVVVVTRDAEEFTRLCLASLLEAIVPPHGELVLVDNGSTDGTVELLARVARGRSNVVMIDLRENRGFAGAVNAGLAAASGDAVVLLNNDTVVPPGAIRRLVRHLEDPAVGLVGCMTNRAGNEAELATSYATFGEMVAFADELAAKEAGRSTEIRTPTMFCVAFRRDLLETVGMLDERFELGSFEDEDYAVRVRAAGLRVVCAEDVFVHHFGQASLGRLAADGSYGTVFHENRRRFEEKWGVDWQPYERRPNDEYATLVERVRTTVCGALPSDARVLVVTKGDDALLELGQRLATHFPAGDDGAYAGYHPADSAAAIAELELRSLEGARYLVLPHTSAWWLDHYVELREYLERDCSVVLNAPGTCAIYAVRESGSHAQ
jgi:GT2 family glycosyltransferase